MSKRTKPKMARSWFRTTYKSGWVVTGDGDWWSAYRWWRAVR